MNYSSPRGLRVERYDPDRRHAWDSFVANGKNATFLFQRGFLDYHSDRFVDHSLLIWRGGSLVGLLPANLKADHTVVSHQGLTYGGFVLSRDATLHDTLEIVQATLGALEHAGIDILIYKRIPRHYEPLPSDEVDYAMFLLDAKLIRRDTAIVVPQDNSLPIRRGKRSQISKGKRAGVRVVEEVEFATYWTQVLVPRLMSRYGVPPVHSLAEIELLASRFPGQIRQFSAYVGAQMAAGVTIFETRSVAHVQYSAIHPNGEAVAALDVLMEWLISDVYKGKKSVDFGICNEREGRALNHGLLQSKEGFGARSVAHDFYEVHTASHTKIEAVLLPIASPACGPTRVC